MLCSVAGKGDLSDGESSRVGSGLERRDPDPGECRKQAALLSKKWLSCKGRGVLRLALGSENSQRTV